MMPYKKGDKMILRCSRCGYEENITKSISDEYRDKKLVSEDKHRGVAIEKTAVSISKERERELLEDYQKQALEMLYEAERESEEGEE